MMPVTPVKLFPTPAEPPAAGGKRRMRKPFGDTIRRSIKAYVSSPAIAYSYDSHYEDTPLLKFDVSFLEEVLAAEGKVLDIGCGTGRHLIELSRRGFKCTGIDLSEHMLNLAQAKLTRAGLEADLVQADMRKPLPFRRAAFGNAICMFSTIGLIPGAAGRKAFVTEVNRLLQPGGIFALHVHNRLHNLWSPWGRRWLLKTYVWNRVFTDLEVGDRVMESYRGIENMYLHVFSLREIRRLLTGGGFEITRIACLNDFRNGELPPGRFASLKANGFLIAAEKR